MYTQEDLDNKAIEIQNNIWNTMDVLTNNKEYIERIKKQSLFTRILRNIFGYNHEINDNVHVLLYAKIAELELRIKELEKDN